MCTGTCALLPELTSFKRLCVCILIFFSLFFVSPGTVHVHIVKAVRSLFCFCGQRRRTMCGIFCQLAPASLALRGHCSQLEQSQVILQTFQGTYVHVYIPCAIRKLQPMRLFFKDILIHVDVFHF